MTDPRRSGVVAVALALGVLALVSAAEEAHAGRGDRRGRMTATTAGPGGPRYPVAQTSNRPAPPARLLRAARSADGQHLILHRSARRRFVAHYGAADKLERLSINSSLMGPHGITLETYELGTIHFPFPHLDEAVVIRGTAGFTSANPSRAFHLPVAREVLKTLGVNGTFRYDEDDE